MSPHLGVGQEVEMLEIGKPKKEDALPVVSPDVELRGKTVKGDDQSELCAPKASSSVVSSTVCFVGPCLWKQTDL